VLDARLRFRGFQQFDEFGALDGQQPFFVDQAAGFDVAAAQRSSGAGDPGSRARKSCRPPHVDQHHLQRRDAAAPGHRTAARLQRRRIAGIGHGTASRIAT
jgi:hypothetical protein